MASKTILIGGKSIAVDAVASLGSAGLITLLALPTGVTAGNYQTFLQNGVAYQVTAGKTLYVARMLIIGTAANAGPSLLGYGDTTVGNSASGPTGFIQLTGSLLAPTANVLQEFSPWLKIPATKYPCFQQSASGATLILHCFEE